MQVLRSNSFILWLTAASAAALGWAAEGPGAERLGGGAPVTALVAYAVAGGLAVLAAVGTVAVLRQRVPARDSR